MLGVLIIALALMGTVAAGFLTSVDKVATTSVGYNYLTDATSLFEFSTEPEYADYSPNINYTHYATTYDGANASTNAGFYTSGIAYTATPGNLVNPYRVYEEQSADSNTITLTNSITRITGSGVSGNHVLLNAYELGTIINNQYVTTVYDRGDLTGASAALLSRILASATVSTISNTHYIDLSASNAPWVICGNNIRWEEIETNSLTHVKKTILRSDDSSFTYGASTYDHIIYDSSTNQATLYDANNVSRWSGSTSNLALIWGGSSTGVTVVTVPTNSITVETTAVQPATYMDISQGVTLTSSDVFWSNGYNLGKVSMILKAPSANGTLTISSYGSSPSTSVGTFAVLYGDAGFDIGDWEAVLLTVDYVNSEITLTGVTNLVSMTDYTVSNYSQTEHIAFSEAPKILKLHSSSVGLWTMNVVSTSVYLDASADRMKDPSINLDAYFLQEEYLRLTFNSFAYYGDSITINGTTIPVNAGKITVHYDGRDRTYSLTNASITWADGKCMLTFNNTKASLDLGEYMTKSVSMAGDWYFNAAVYEGELKDSHEYKFDFGSWGISESGFILIFLGILILAAMIIHVKRGLSALDIAVLVLVGLVAFLLMS